MWKLGPSPNKFRSWFSRENRLKLLLFWALASDGTLYSCTRYVTQMNLSICQSLITPSTTHGWDAYLLLLSVILTINHTTKEEEDDLDLYATENFRPNFYAWLAEASLLKNLWYHKHNAGRKVANLKLTKSISSMSWSKSMTMEVRDSILFSWN
jgi:hypothetical protein